MSKRWINFASGWDKSEGQDLKVSLNVDWNKNAKNNKGQAYKMFLVPVDESGDPNGDHVEVQYFNLKTSKADKQRFPNAPDYQVSMVVED